MSWTIEQLQNHPKKDALLGLKPNQKASDAQIAADYKLSGSVWKTAERLGMCGQSVWERVVSLGIVNKYNYTPDQEKAIIAFYATDFKKGDLDRFCKDHGLLKTSVSRWAGRQGITRKDRQLTDAGTQALSARSKKWHAANQHPKGMLGKKHTAGALNAISLASLAAWKNMTREAKRMKTLRMLKTKAANGTLIAPRRVTWKQGWMEIGGKRIFVRSSWEARYARFLEMLKRGGEIINWEYEPETFWFDGIRKGTTNYTPDFKVYYPDGRIEFHEIKGWMDTRSRTKLKRMKKYHPDVVLKVLDSAWFKANKKNLPI